MKIKHTKPEIYERCKKAFGVDWDRGIIITYGDTVYCKNNIPDHLEVHEATHIEQQRKYGVEEWWNRYFIDDEFRFSQEIEAYKNQVAFIRGNYNRQQRRSLEKQICKSMSRLYGGMCTKEEAKEILK